MSEIDCSLLKSPISSQAKGVLIKRLWKLGNGFEIDKAGFEDAAYLAYYFDQCKHALHDEEHILVKTRRDIFELAEQIMEGSSRDRVMETLSLKHPDSDEEAEVERKAQLDHSIDLAVRLISMMDIGVPCCRLVSQKPVTWEQGSFREFVQDRFDNPIVMGDKVQLGVSFNVRKLAQVGQIRIDWTSNILDHLRYTDNGVKKVAIFHHASFLNCQQSSILPSKLVDETLKTLALLFPQSDKKTVDWFRRQCTDFPHLDGQVVNCGNLRQDDRQIHKFEIWHDRLVMLKEAFDEIRPSTISQFWYDRRNGVQWYTFWVAVLVLILTIFFGVVQSVEGALQVFKAYHPTTGADAA